jgi:hypothetical protein
MIEHLFHFALRTFLGRSWNELMLATHEPEREQSNRLLDIISQNKRTAFGIEHGFDGIDSVEDFRERVPVRTYEGFEPYIKRMRTGEEGVLTAEVPLMFGRTSGTTGSPKFIPITSSFYEDFSRTQKMWQLKMVGDHRKMLRGKILSVMSPEVEGYTECGIPYGAMSGYSYNNQYGITRGLQAVPYEVLCVSDFDLKYYLFLRLALEQNVTAVAAVNPSTIVLLMKKLNAHASELVHDIAEGDISGAFDVAPRLKASLRERLRPNKKRARELESLLARGEIIRGTDVWKNLSIITTWQGGPASFFLRTFPDYFPGISVRDMGFMATEGYFSIPLHSNTPDGLLAVTGHFMEFFEVEPDGSRAEKALGCEELETGKQYYVVVTTSGGLYRYDIGDIVEVSGFYNKTPLLVFKQKGGSVLSITGEKVTEAQVVEAMNAAVASHGGNLEFVKEGFMVAIRLDDPPAYSLALEATECDSSSLAEFLTSFEAELRRRNIEYAAKRDSQRLGSPTLRVLRPGFFERMRQKRVRDGTPDGQYKVSHVAPDSDCLNGEMPVFEIEMPTIKTCKSARLDTRKNGYERESHIKTDHILAQR